MRTHEEIILELAKINIGDISLGVAPETLSSGVTIRSLVVDARHLAAGDGPKTRPAQSAKHSDDYMATVQIAIGIGYDGTLTRRSEIQGPPSAMIPAIGAVDFVVEGLQIKAAEATSMSLTDFLKATTIVQRSIRQSEFDKAWEGVRDEGSRTEEKPNLIITNDSDLQS